MLTVLGEALIDLVADDTGRYTAHPGGSPLNVAVGLARLGHPTELMARLSGDAFGRKLRAHAEGNGVLTDSAVRASEPSTLAVVSLDEQGRAEYDFYVKSTADWQWSREELAGISDATTVFHTGSIASWTPPGSKRIAALCAVLRERGTVLLTYDPNARPRLMGSAAKARAHVERNVALAHVVKCSDEDHGFLYPSLTVEEVVKHWISLGAALVVVTHGPQGALAGSASGQRVRRPTIPIVLADTIGAGDAYMAGLLASLYGRGLATPAAIGGLSEDDISQTLDDATLVAALTCERAGADPPTAAEFAAAHHRIEPSHTAR